MKNITNKREKANNVSKQKKKLLLNNKIVQIDEANKRNETIFF
jgi:hypothetical protein